MAREPSPTDLRLADELASLGRPATPRQIARWREAKIFVYKRQFNGRGQGSSSSYEPHVLELVAALHDLLRQRRSLRDAVLILFARGYDLNIDVVRAALLDYVENVEHVLRRVLKKAETPAALRAALEGSKEGRAIRRHLDVAGLDEGAFAAVVQGLCGERESWGSQFLDATGFKVIAASILDAETAAAVEAQLDNFTLPQLRSAVSHTAPAAVREALEDSRVIVPFIAHFVELLARTTGRNDVLLLDVDDELNRDLAVAHWTVISMWAREHGLDLDEGRRQACVYGAGVAGLIDLARTFSFARGPLFGPNGAAIFDQLAQYEQESITERVHAWMGDHLEETTAIHELIADSSSYA